MLPDFTAEEIERFWSYVGHSGDANACWEWQKSRDWFGHGKASFHRMTIGAHRVAYHIAISPIPDQVCVCHTCDNPACCNPAHLFLGTNLDNIKDRHKKHRDAFGERNGRARFTDNDIRHIRLRHANGESQGAIARALGTTQSCISRIINRKTWRHVS